jgi:hypothetical protein
MSAPTTTTTAHPYDHARRYPDGEGSIPVDWSARREGVEDLEDVWQSFETVEYGDHTLVADAYGNPVGAVVDGDYVPAHKISEYAEEEDEQDPGGFSTLDEDDEPPTGPWRTLADAIDEAEDDGCGGGPEGPLMNYFYLLERGGPYGRTPDLAQWAAKLDGLPLCAVELDGDYGLALTGGGMDLSWEIAEAHLRLGYRVPTWVNLPAMAQGGRLGKDFRREDEEVVRLDEDDAAIVRAVIRDRRAEAERHTYVADHLARRYGITETTEES